MISMRQYHLLKAALQLKVVDLLRCNGQLFCKSCQKARMVVILNTRCRLLLLSRFVFLSIELGFDQPEDRCEFRFSVKLESLVDIPVHYISFLSTRII